MPEDRGRENLHRFCYGIFVCVSSDCVGLFSVLMDVHYRYIRQHRDDVFMVMEVKVMVKVGFRCIILMYDPV